MKNMDDNKALLDRAPEIVAALRCMEREIDCTDCHYYNGIICEPKRLDADAVALLEAMAAQLAAVTAERDAAYEKICNQCDSIPCLMELCPWWRGPQGAGEGEK